MKKICLTLSFLLLSNLAFATDYTITVSNQEKTLVAKLDSNQNKAVLHFGKKYSIVDTENPLYDGNTVNLTLKHINNKDILMVSSDYNQVSLVDFSIDSNPYNEEDARKELDDSLDFVNKNGTEDQKVAYKNFYDKAVEPEINTMTLPSTLNYSAFEEINLTNVNPEKEFNITPHAKLNTIKLKIETH